MAIQLKDQASVKQVLAEMTLEEKATLVTGGSSFGTAAIPRLGIPSALLIDAGGGVNLRQYLANLLNTGKLESAPGLNGAMGSLSRLVFIMDHLEDPDSLTEEERDLLDRFLSYLRQLVPCGDLPSCFPVNSLLASTWNPETVLACGRQVGREAAAFGVDMLLGTPCVNIQRDPRGGRGFEGYSEDPYLISRLAPNYAIGVQEQGVCADVKHFAVNNQETNRQTVCEQVSERAMQEIYFPGFRSCVQEGGVKNVMTAYNWINGEACAHNRWMLQEVLREQWGFEGFVVSDWGGVYDQVAALRAGNDLCMPGPRGIEPVVEAVRSGELPEAVLDASVERILRVLVEMPVMRGRSQIDIDSEAARQVAYDAAADGIILLKNNGVLPLTPGTHAAFYGARSGRFLESGIGSGRVHTNKTSSMVDWARRIAGADRVTVDRAAPETDVIVVTVSAHGQEGADRQSIQLDPAERRTLLKALEDAKVNQCQVVLVLNVAGPVELQEFVNQVDAILCVYFPGQEGGHAAADILYGNINPSGKLAQTFPKHLYDCPAYGNFPGENNRVCYGEGIYVGYRYYDSRHIEPLFPFGHGLSYTTFCLSNLRLQRETFRYEQEDSLSVTVRVTNTGPVPGKEVVQLYLSDENSTLQRPVRELKGFCKVALEPGESRDVTLELTRESLCAYDERLHGWVCEPGWFCVQVGNSSRNLPLEGRFKAVGRNPYAYGPGTQFAALAKDARASQVLLEVLPKEVLTPEELRRQTTYVAFSFTLQDAWEQNLRPALRGYSEAEAQVLYARLCAALEEIDVSAGQASYQETEVY